MEMQTTQTPELPRHYLRPRQWEAMTGMTIWAAYKALKAGTLRGVKIGSTWFIEASEIEDYFTRHKNAA